MAFVNLSFEDPGSSSGDANGWTRVFIALAEEIADYGPDHSGIEGFSSGWSNDTFLFAFAGFGTDLSQALYVSPTLTPKTADDFESGWGSNEGFETGLGSSTSAVYDGNQFENFEQSWDNSAFVTAFVGIGTDLTAATFVGSGAAETFGTGWSTNQSFVFAFVGIGTDLTAAQYASGFGGPNPFESFEFTEPHQTFSVDPGTDIFTGSAGVGSGDKITFIPDTSPGAYLPGGLSTARTYYGINPSGLTFQVSLTLAGAAFDVTDAGAGINVIRSDPALFWVDFMTTI